jgi:hypothetical protein
LRMLRTSLASRWRSRSHPPAPIGILAHRIWTGSGLLAGLQSPAIPVDRLVAYVNDQEAGNWLGISYLRPYYKHWLRKDRLLRVDAINAERNGAGVPLAYAPPNATKDQIKELSALAQSYRAGESAGGSLPNGAELRFRGVEGTLPMSSPASATTRADDSAVPAQYSCRSARPKPVGEPSATRSSISLLWLRRQSQSTTPMSRTST